ncbi:hypothetical protein, partial [Burkholderia lata]|uniref:hypothetical protein n=1 Tax=Burkholderia lata (strain ATCC 17760 / DSM 23089 / LMG 22485 / NCIMB 9086 / R18194 / 383) TaxID=482957 RepID=UPI001C2E928F
MDRQIPLGHFTSFAQGSKCLAECLILTVHTGQLKSASIIGGRTSRNSGYTPNFRLPTKHICQSGV